MEVLEIYLKTSFFDLLGEVPPSNQLIIPVDNRTGKDVAKLQKIRDVKKVIPIDGLKGVYGIGVR